VPHYLEAKPKIWIECKCELNL